MNVPRVPGFLEPVLMERDLLPLDDLSFAKFLERVRAGDERLTEDLVRHYEPLIRFEVRRRLRDPRLRRVFDSMDISQSVFSSFLIAAGKGRYELDSPQRLLALLVGMARNKLAYHVRKERAQQRDHRRATHDGLTELPGNSTVNPSRILEGKDYLEALRQCLTREERQIADLRAQGVAWSDVAARLGGTPQARRMQLARALDAARKRLGHGEVNDGQRG